MNRLDTLTLLKQVKPFDEVEEGYVKETIAMVEQSLEFWSERSLNGHITTSAWIVTEDGSKALLLHSAKFDMWLQAGGHAEDSDETLQASALREGKEETGLDQLKAVSTGIFDVDVHSIPEKKGIPAHTHYDLRFLFTVDYVSAAAIILNAESKGYQWVDTVELARVEHSASIRRMACKTIAAFALSVPTNPPGQTL